MKRNAGRVLGALLLAATLALPTIGAVGQQSPTQPAPRPEAQAAAQEADTSGVVTPGGREDARQPREGEDDAAERPRQVIVTTPATPKGPVRVVHPKLPSPQEKRSRILRPGVPLSPFEPLLQKELTYGEVPDVGEPISLDASRGGIPVAELLDTIARATGWNILASQGIETKLVRTWLTGVSPKKALEILKFNEVWYDFDPESQFLYVMTKEEFLERNFGELKRKEFRIEHADVMDMEAILTSLLSPKGRIVADPRSGNIIAWDTEENLIAMQETEQRVDVPLVPQSYQIRYLDPEAGDLLGSLESVLSERGVAQFDPRSNTLVVTDMPSRQEQIGKMIQALDQQVRTRTWKLNYTDAEIIAERLENVIPGGVVSITFDEEKHQVSVTAVEERLTEVDELMSQWDVKGRQVLIEAFLVAAGTDIARGFGIDWSYLGQHKGNPFLIQHGNPVPDYTGGPDQGQRVTVGTLPYPVPLRDPVTGDIIEIETGTDAAGNPITEPLLMGGFERYNLAVVLNYLDSTGDLTILSRPRVTVQDGQEASFEYVTELPYQEGGYSQYTSTDTTNPNFNRVIPLRVQFVEVGTVLKVEPRISDDDNVLMAIEAEDSTAENVEVTVGDQNSTVPSKTQNRAETQVLVHDGQTIVIGGLRSSAFEDDVERVPVLGEIPLLGRLFRNTSKRHRDRELFIFITSTIVDEYTHPEAERIADLEESVTDSLRHDRKSIWQRAKDRIAKGNNELGVSIGQSGAMHSEGEPVTLDELRATFNEAAQEERTPKIVIRSHPRAPGEIETEVAEAAMEANLDVVFDDDRVPFVAAQPPTEGPTP